MYDQGTLDLLSQMPQDMSDEDSRKLLDLLMQTQRGHVRAPTQQDQTQQKPTSTPSGNFGSQLYKRFLGNSSAAPASTVGVGGADAPALAGLGGEATGLEGPLSGFGLDSGATAGFDLGGSVGGTGVGGIAGTGTGAGGSGAGSLAAFINPWTALAAVILGTSVGLNKNHVSSFKNQLQGKTLNDVMDSPNVDNHVADIVGDDQMHNIKHALRPFTDSADPTKLKDLPSDIWKSAKAPWRMLADAFHKIF